MEAVFVGMAFATLVLSAICVVAVVTDVWRDRHF